MRITRLLRLRCSPPFTVFSLALSILPLPAVANHCNTGAGSGITLLEPIGSTHCFTSSMDAIVVLNAYLGTMLPWLLGLCATFTVLMVVLGGLQIIMSAGEEAAMQKGKDRIFRAIVGLCLLIFSAAILQFMNASFFTL